MKRTGGAAWLTKPTGGSTGLGFEVAWGAAAAAGCGGPGSSAGGSGASGQGSAQAERPPDRTTTARPAQGAEPKGLDPSRIIQCSDTFRTWTCEDCISWRWDKTIVRPLYCRAASGVLPALSIA